MTANPPIFQSSQQRVGGAFGISFGLHAVAVAMAVFLALHPQTGLVVSPAFSESLSSNIVWLNVPGPGGGGGGGGSQSPLPPRKAQEIGKDRLTVPAVKAASLELTRENKPPPVQAVDAPVETLASAMLPLPGVIEKGLLDGQSRGPGRGPGVGDGDGNGIGPGQGPGIGSGRNGGCCEGAYRPGSGIEVPRLLKEVKPQYTAPAMRAKIQGSVVLECIVGPDGSVGNMRVLRSLDSLFGLDQEAMKAARLWQFAPGRRQGEPVPVLVTIQIDFTLR